VREVTERFAVGVGSAALDFSDDGFSSLRQKIDPFVQGFKVGLEFGVGRFENRGAVCEV
jgi:hypothetical protein